MLAIILKFCQTKDSFQAVETKHVTALVPSDHNVVNTFITVQMAHGSAKHFEEVVSRLRLGVSPREV